MAGFQSFQVSRNKYTKGVKDVHKQEKYYNNANENLSKSEKLRKGFKIWTSFYRANPHRFAKDYLGLKLKLFQMILLYMMNHTSMFMYLAARGQGKSYIIAVFCVVRSILYPSTKIIVASGTKGQAKLIVSEKIEKELMMYPNIAREIKDIKNSNNQVLVVFQNGSTIEAVTSTDSARGYRGQILILDEFRLIKEENYKRVLRPFLNVVRQPPYLNNPKYAHLTEENKEIMISSAWYKNHWIWTKFNAFKNAMARGKSYFVCALPYTLSKHHGLLTEERINMMKNEDDMDAVTWLMEMDCMFFGESEKAYYKLDDIQKCRTLIKPFYPTEHTDFISNKGKRKKSTKQDGEIRLIGMDIAMMAGQANDSTVFTCMRLLPNGINYIKQVTYIESINGQHSEKQAVRLKQLYSDFEADYVAMDTNGNGLSVFDDCSRVLYDEERDIEYPAWTCMNDEEMKKRSLTQNALEVIYSMKVTKAELNHEIAVALRAAFEKRLVRLLVDDIQGKEYLMDKHNLLMKPIEEQVNLIKPYVQTTALVNEIVNLEYEIRSGFVKVKEVGANRKDRFSSLAYCNYYAKLLESENLREESDIDATSFLFFN